jgi:Uma2 family endonuclease
VSTVVEPESKLLSSPDDPFRYGWRYVRQVGPDGKETRKQVPLILEDVLHPQDEDFRVHSEEDRRDLEYMGNVLDHHLAGRAIVLVDHRLLWDDPDLGVHGPDLAVIPGRTVRLAPGSTFEVAAEGVRPVLIGEVVSPDTRSTDLVTKVEEYHRAGVPFYVIVDTRYRGGRRVHARILGYRYAAAGYEPMPLDELGRLWLEPLGLWMGIKGVQVVFYDTSGKELERYADLAQARAEAEARAKDAEARIRELEERLRRVEKPAGNGNQG